MLGRSRSRARSRMHGGAKGPPTVILFPDVVIGGSLITPNLASPMWQAGSANASARVATSGEGADPAVTTYYLNPGANAPANGALLAQICAAPGETTATFQFYAKLPTGVLSGTIGTGVVNAAHSGFVVAAASCVLSSSWQLFTVSITGMVAGTEYALAIYCNYLAVCTAQAQALIKSCVCTPTNGTGVVGAASSTRYDVPPSQGWDVKSTDTLLSGSIRQWAGPSGQQVSFIPSTTKFALEYSSNVTNTDDVIMSVFQSGSLITSFNPATFGSLLYTGDITVTAGVRVDIVAGMRWGYNTGNDGCRIRAIHVNDAGASLRMKPPARQVVVLGDSIACGFQGSPASQFGYFEVMRRSMATPIALECYSGNTLNNIAANAGGVSSTVTLLGQYGVGSGVGTVVIIELGTNDFGGAAGAVWNAASYGTQLAALADAIHAADATVTVIFQTAIHRTDEASANTFGNILSDYISQMTTVQSTRPAWSKLVTGQTQLLTAQPLGANGVHPTGPQFATMAANFIPILNGFGIG